MGHHRGRVRFSQGRPQAILGMLTHCTHKQRDSEGDEVLQPIGHVMSTVADERERMLCSFVCLWHL